MDCRLEKMCRWVVAFAVTTLACGGPTTPTALTPSEQSDFSGVWQGQYLITQCGGTRHCPNLGTAVTFSLRLSQSLSNVVGVLTIGHQAILGGISVDVTGTISSKGSLTLT